MSQATREFFNHVKDDKSMGVLEAAKEGILAIAPGLRNMAADFGAEMNRMKVQGTMEMASALFRGDAFVPYGPGQRTREAEKGQEQHKEEQQHERGGREM